jgi:hypothetical protein
MTVDPVPNEPPSSVAAGDLFGVEIASIAVGQTTVSTELHKKSDQQ